MNQILEKLKSVLQEAEALIESLKKQKNDLGLSHALLDKGHEELKTKTVDIAQREAVIAPIENFNKVKKDNDAKSVELQTGLSDLDAKKKAFESYRQIETDKLNNLRITVEKENNNVNQAHKNIEAEIDRRVKEFISKHLTK
jgi:hypothetical protein